MWSVNRTHTELTRIHQHTRRLQLLCVFTRKSHSLSDDILLSLPLSTHSFQSLVLYLCLSFEQGWSDLRVNNMHTERRSSSITFCPPCDAFTCTAPHRDCAHSISVFCAFALGSPIARSQARGHTMGR